MSEPRDHHFVPKFYLRQFADGQGRLAVRDRTHGMFTNTVKKLMYERDLYKIPDQQLTAEQTLGKLEGGAAEAIRGLVTGLLPAFNSADRDALELFMAMQLHRAPASLSQLAFVREALDSLGRPPVPLEAVGAYLASQWGFEPSEAEVRGAHTIINVEQVFEMPSAAEMKRMELNLMFEMAVRTVEFIRARTWRLEVSRTALLVTSDRPVVQWHPEGDADRSGGIGVPELEEIWFIVDPLHMLVLRRDGSERVRRIGPERVDFVNRHVARHCSHQIVTHPTNAATLAGLPLGRRRPLVRFYEGEVKFRSTGETGEVVQTWSPMRDLPDDPALPDDNEPRSFFYNDRRNPGRR